MRIEKEKKEQGKKFETNENLRGQIHILLFILSNETFD